MPEGLEQDLSPADLVDIAAWMATAGPPPKSLPGNTPQLVTGGADGVLVLPASQAEIYGGEITFETGFGNIGLWHGGDDHVVWTIDVAHDGDFDVWLDHACDAGSAGNLLALTVAGERLEAPIASTGGWSHYTQTNLGRVWLAAGTHRVRVEPATGRLTGALVDLRTVAFAPAGSPCPVGETAAAAIGRMVSDLEPGTPEEYRRIPEIWQVAVAAGRRNVDDELLAILRVALPADGQRLTDWQAVVLGGGIVNGVSQAGDWPAERIATLLAGDAAGDLARRWQQALQASLPMADDAQVPSGTRYDALRMAAMLGWDEAAATLERFAAAGSEAELQMGAVSGACDVPDPRAARLLIDVIPHAPPANRDLALDGLLRSEERCLALLDAVRAGRLSRDLLGDGRIARLREHASARVRTAAETALR